MTPRATLILLSGLLSPPSPISARFFFHSSADHRHLHSFPTRRSSDLTQEHDALRLGIRHGAADRRGSTGRVAGDPSGDRKSTRLNSSHQIISYAVFCLKKKKCRPSHQSCV